MKLSKFLSYICRHGAEKEGIPIRDGGFLNVHEVLSKSREQYSKEDVERVVAQCSKQRFALRNDPITGSLQIRANQGHTIPVGVGQFVYLFWGGRGGRYMGASYFTYLSF